MMKAPRLLRRAALLSLPALGLGCAQSSPFAAAAPRLRATLGALETPARVCGAERASACRTFEQANRSPKMRAQALEGPGDAAELDFLYLGPTAEIAPLASGEKRRQLGLKLRSQDSCNVLYVMWRIEPEAGLFISRKSNPGAHTHEACGTAGYRTRRARLARPLPALVPGARHRLGARLEGRALRIWLDGALVWEGAVDDAALRFEGPIGVRSDNVRFAFRLRTP